MAIRSLFITLFFLFASTLSGQTVKVYVSSKTGDRIAAKPDLQFSDAQPTQNCGSAFGNGVKKPADVELPGFVCLG